MKNILVVLCLLSSFVFAQMTDVEVVRVQKLKTMPLTELKAIVDASKGTTAYTALTSLYEERLNCANRLAKVNQYQNQHPAVVNNGRGHKNSIKNDNDSLLLVIVERLDQIDGRLDNIETTLARLEKDLKKSEAKVDELCRLVVILSEKIETVTTKIDKSGENSGLQYLSRAELVLFNPDYLAITTNDEVVNELARKLSTVLNVDVNPLHFERYRKGELTGEPLILMKRILKTIGTIEGSPSVVWSFFVEESANNAALIRNKFAQF